MVFLGNLTKKKYLELFSEPLHLTAMSKRIIKKYLMREAYRRHSAQTKSLITLEIKIKI